MQNINRLDYMLPEGRGMSSVTGWSIWYGYGKPTDKLPRVLMIGDSICNFYQRVLKDMIADFANLSFFATSKCVTDRIYLQELEQKLDLGYYDMISFNNGLHSLDTPLEDYDEAYEKCVDFIRAKCPDSKLYITLSTPLKDEKLTAISSRLNETARRVADERGLPVIDLFSLMKPLDRERYWIDVFHFGNEAVQMQSDKLAEIIAAELKNK